MASRRSNHNRRDLALRETRRERDRYQRRAHFLRRDLEAQKLRAHRLAEIAVSQEAELSLAVHSQAAAL
jgi:hypothetical protein